MKIEHIALFSAILASPVLTACGSDDVPSKSVLGRWDGPGKVTIDVQANGSARGNDGCNDLEAAWKPDDDESGKFQVTEASEIGCAGIVGWGDAVAYSIAGDSLTIKGSDGKDLSVLQRAD